MSVGKALTYILSMHSPVTDEERQIVVAGQLDIDGIEHEEYVPPSCFRKPRKPAEAPPQDDGA